MIASCMMGGVTNAGGFRLTTGVPALAALAQEVIAKGQSGHGFDHGDSPGQDACVVASAGFEFNVFEVSGDGLLRMENGGGWFEGDAEEDVLPVGDAALDASGAIGGGTDSSLAHPEGVVVGFAGEEGAFEAGPDFETFCCGEAEHPFGEVGFEFIENGFAETGGCAPDDAFDDAADGVALGADVFDPLDHPVCGFGIWATDHVRLDLFEGDGGWVDVGLDVLDGSNVGDDFDFGSERFNDLLRNGCSGDTTDGFAGGGASSSLPVTDTVLGLVGVVRV